MYNIFRTRPTACHTQAVFRSAVPASLRTILLRTAQPAVGANCVRPSLGSSAQPYHPQSIRKGAQCASDDVALGGNQSPRVEGSVLIQYRDPVTDKVVKQTEDHNHAFLGMFSSLAWEQILSLTTQPIFFLSNDPTPPSNDFPYLRGETIGWGTVNGVGSGSYLGSWAAGIGYIRQPITEYEGFPAYGMQWRYAFDFAANQILQEIGSLGITAQYMPYVAGASNTYPIRRIRYEPAENVYYVYKNNKGYSITDAGIVSVYNPVTREKTTIDVSDIAETGAILCVGANAATDRMYIFKYHATAANRRMYEYSDDTFTTVLQTWSPTNITAYPTTNRIFVVQDNFMFYWNANWMRCDFVNNVNTAVMTFPAHPLLTARMAANTNSMLLKDGNCYIMDDFTTSSNNIILNMASQSLMAYYNPAARTGTRQAQHAIVDMIEPPNNGILLSSSLDQYYYHKQALTCFVPQADPRPPNTAIRIIYTITVLY